MEGTMIVHDNTVRGKLLSLSTLILIPLSMVLLLVALVTLKTAAGVAEDSASVVDVDATLAVIFAVSAIAGSIPVLAFGRNKIIGIGLTLIGLVITVIWWNCSIGFAAPYMFLYDLLGNAGLLTLIAGCGGSYYLGYAASCANRCSRWLTPVIVFFGMLLVLWGVIYPSDRYIIQLQEIHFRQLQKLRNSSRPHASAEANHPSRGAPTPPSSARVKE
jgi:hypothetical protein